MFRLLRPDVELQSCRLAGSRQRLLTCRLAILIIDHHLQFAWLILHVVPAQTVAVKTVLHSKRPLVELLILLFYYFLDASLTLAVDEELSLIIVGVAKDGRYLADAVLRIAFAPAPMGQQMDGVLLLLPVRAIEIVAILGQTSQVADAEIAAA